MKMSYKGLGVVQVKKVELWGYFRAKRAILEGYANAI